MKQILQNLGNGETALEDVPTPESKSGTLLIATTQSLVSAGTERMLVDFGKANLLDKARQQPDKVKMVLDKIRTDGLGPTIETVRNKLDQSIPLGYCNVGTVGEVGAGVTGFKVGDRVASNGQHAEVVRVPGNLCALVPDNVVDEAAAFTVIGAVALQGIRLVQPTLGETVVVTGLGLVGLITVQLLRAQGCRVLGIDLDPSRVALARGFGAECVDLSAEEDPLQVAGAWSRGRGVDAVIITASTRSNEPVSQAAKMCRKRGRIVLVGVTGLELSRADFFEKELSFQVSCSYGPGRYDPEYEDKGHDYPGGFVRWTEQRNMEAVLDMMASGALDVEALISHRFELGDALEAYALLGSGETSMGILLEYPGVEGGDVGRTVVLESGAADLADMNVHPAGTAEAVVGFVGAGNYAGAVLVPAFKAAGAVLRTVASSGGVSGVHVGKKHGFAQTTTDAASVFADAQINTVVVATRHDSHARFVLDGLRAGKHVFMEKPLALTAEELASIDEAWLAQNGECRLMVGYNRRFSPLTLTMKALLDKVAGPKTFILTMNAGAIPADHWTQNRALGGGRIIGEACHYIDLLRFLVGAPIKSFTACSLGAAPGMDITEDKASITLSFEDGSIGTIHYFANGGKAFPKERIEAFGGDGVLQLDNFKRLKGFGWKGFKSQRLRSQDKGQIACAAAFVQSIRSGAPTPIAYEEIMEVARVSIDVAELLRGG